MNRFEKSILLSLTASLAYFLTPAQANAQKFRHVASPAEISAIATLAGEPAEETDSIPPIILAEPDSLVSAYYSFHNIMPLKPRVFSGYRGIYNPTAPEPVSDYTSIAGVVEDRDSVFMILRPSPLPEGFDDNIPAWLRTAMRAERIIGNLEYSYMISNPLEIETAYWDLPVPPRLPEEDKSFAGYLKRLDLPDIDPSKATLPEIVREKRHWLHTLNVGLQFSQAYVSSNWYQGGNDYLALLFNFAWNVELNTVFHPNLLFQSALQYKLGINSTPRESLHAYNISQDLFQYNLKTGFKAFTNWFYSFNLQFNTQLFNAYPDDSDLISASFLSPGSLNLGLGMTYNFQNKKKTFKLSLSISPIAYNLKTCVNNRIDPVQFNIKPGRHSVSEAGSNLEGTFEWAIRDNIHWKSRIFLFTDYKYFLADYESTLDFAINRFLSTQLYLHPRYDSSSDFMASRWHYWMLREILSFGLSYTFSTK